MPFSRLMPSGIVSASALAPRRLGALAAASLLIATAGGVLVAERGRQQRPAAPVIQARPLRILFLGSEAPPHASSAIYTAIAPVLGPYGVIRMPILDAPRPLCTRTLYGVGSERTGRFHDSLKRRVPPHVGFCNTLLEDVSKPSRHRRYLTGDGPTRAWRSRFPQALIDAPRASKGF